MRGRTLVIAPHGDDELLGVGGTMARRADAGDEVHVLITTRGYPPQFSEESARRTSAGLLAAHCLLGVTGTTILDFPAAGLDIVPHSELNTQLLAVVERIRPELVFLPFNGDIHRDHQRVFLSAMVALRPNGSFTARAIYAYETLSETNWGAPYLMPNFVPNVYVDISAFLETKIRAMEAVDAQIKPFPHERSAQALRALATLRGATVGCPAAEGFVLVRQTT
jgi:LmbE family N-acetylglucosaminyl deacetylase